MNTFFISDTHFNHARIIELCKRPFDDVEEMNEALIKNWNENVGPADHVWFLGDFIWPKPGKTEVDYLSRLNGRKHLILGNHDNEYVMRRMVDQYKLLDTVDNYFELKIAKKLIVLMHYPIDDWNKKFHGSIHIHGHVHNQPHYVIKHNRFNASVENIDYAPIELGAVLNRIEEQNASL